MGRKTTLLALVLPAVTAAWPAATSCKPLSVTGNIVTREREPLPPGYLLRVELRDISRQDVAAEEISSREWRPNRQLPVRFSLPYKAERIDPSHMYAVAARILIDGRLAFISTRIHAVLTRGAPAAVDIVLEKVRRSGE